MHAAARPMLIHHADAAAGVKEINRAPLLRVDRGADPKCPRLRLNGDGCPKPLLLYLGQQKQNNHSFAVFRQPGEGLDGIDLLISDLPFCLISSLAVYI